jgi:tRNA-specific 2-thiouridylase
MKALALFSGGLDSALAIKIIQEQNIEVEGIYVDIGFESNKEKQTQLKKLAEELGIKLTIFDIKDDYIKNILFNPVYGYGKNMNPCIDCHAKMIKVAKEYLKESKAKFIINGEVVGQRPMSQRLPAMNAVTKLSTAKGLILRPLSAKLLPPTIPEIKGWVDREKLLAISGRDRKIQLELAKKYNLQNFESPAGGCLLTDINFSRRLKTVSKNIQFTADEIEILKVGRHFNVNGYTIIISRNKDENKVLKEYKGNNFFKAFPNFKGPIGLVQSNAPTEIKQLCADMIASYSKENGRVFINQEEFISSKKNREEFRIYLVNFDK